MLEKAIHILTSGGVIAFPTETVYGLGADARNEQAVRRIFELKQRPLNHPLIVHLANPNMASDWGKQLSPAFHQLARHFWPGALTLIVKKQHVVLDVVTAGQGTVGLRVPSHPVAQALLQGFGGGIAAPSANIFTHISPTTANAVYAEFGDQVDLILEGGDCEVGLESTIVDVSGDSICILRPGMITQHDIERVLSEPVTLGYKKMTVDLPRVPGMHHVHYAPRTPTFLRSRHDLIRQQVNSLSARIGVIFCGTKCNLNVFLTEVIELPHEAKQYAHEVYRQLRFLDELHLDEIWIESVPDSEEWEGIRDRLNKASHP